jgi:hypothetical protein
MTTEVTTYYTTAVADVATNRLACEPDLYRRRRAAWLLDVQRKCPPMEPINKDHVPLSTVPIALRGGGPIRGKYSGHVIFCAPPYRDRKPPRIGTFAYPFEWDKMGGLGGVWWTGHWIDIGGYEYYERTKGYTIRKGPNAGKRVEPAYLVWHVPDYVEGHPQAAKRLAAEYRAILKAQRLSGKRPVRWVWTGPREAGVRPEDVRHLPWSERQRYYTKVKPKREHDARLARVDLALADSPDTLAEIAATLGEPLALVRAREHLRLGDRTAPGRLGEQAEREPKATPLRSRRRIGIPPGKTYHVKNKSFKGDEADKLLIAIQPHYYLPNGVYAPGWGSNRTQIARTRQLFWRKPGKRQKGTPGGDEEEAFAKLIADSSDDFDRAVSEVAEIRPEGWVAPEDRPVYLETALQEAKRDEFAVTGEGQPDRALDAEKAVAALFDEPDELDMDLERHALLKPVKRLIDQADATRGARLFGFRNGPWRDRAKYAHLADLEPGEVLSCPVEHSKAKLHGFKRPASPRDPKTLGVLTERQYETCMWCYGYGYTNAQAALRMGVSPETVKDALDAGRKKLEAATGVKIKGRRRGAAVAVKVAA